MTGVRGRFWVRKGYALEQSERTTELKATGYLK
jgi:hypothetical protein